MSHSHSHGAGCGHEADDDHVHPDDGDQDFLFPQIDRDRVEALNEATAGSGKLVIKPWDQRNDNTQFLESDADEQLILSIPFTSSVKLRAIIIGTENGQQAPTSVKVFANENSLDFDDATQKVPVQTIELVTSNTSDSKDPVEYTVKPSKFSNVQNITLFFPDNGGAPTSKVYFVGFKGEHGRVTGRLTGIVYEAQANPADHPKIPGMTDSASLNPNGF